MCWRKSKYNPLGDQLKKTDKFFSITDDTSNAAWNRQWFENFEGYADKYRDAAISLYESIVNRFDKDKFAYPIMFLSRHCAELRLKSIIHYLNADDSYKDKDNKHSLLVLWNIVDSLYMGQKVGGYQYANSLINELNRYDCKSDTFRYPVHNNNIHTNTAEFIDIDAFYRTFRKLDLFLEGMEAEVQASADNV